MIQQKEENVVKVAMFSFMRLFEGSIIPTVQIAKLLRDELRLPVATDKQHLDELPKDLDLFIMINGAFAYCKCLYELSEVVSTARRLVWVQNDYTIIPPRPDSGAESPFRKAFRVRRERGLPDMDFWTTCAHDKMHTPMTPLSSRVNWNCLTMDAPRTAEELAMRRMHASNTLLYYGCFRDGRREGFDRFFRSPEVDVMISAPPGPQATAPDKMFRKHYPRCKTIAPIDTKFHATLASHGLGLYLQDKKSHSEDHSPPNRFYEMLSAGLPIVFQREAGTAMRRGGYNPDPYAVHTSLEVKRAMMRRLEIGDQQTREWLPRAREERDQLVPSIHAAYAKVTDALS